MTVRQVLDGLGNIKNSSDASGRQRDGIVTRFFSSRAWRNSPVKDRGALAAGFLAMAWKTGRDYHFAPQCPTFNHHEPCRVKMNPGGLSEILRDCYKRDRNVSLEPW